MKLRIYIYCIVIIALLYVSKANERTVELSSEFLENIAQFINVSQFNTDISFKLKVDNPTMFDLKYISINGMEYKNYKVLSDSVVSFEFSDKIIQYLVNIYFYGKVLCGNDTVFNITIEDLKINSVEYDKIIFNYKVISDFNALPYLRFPEIIKVYPNPIEYTDKFYCEFIVDYLDKISISVIDIYGQEIIINTFENTQKGKVTFEVPIDYRFISGVYYLVIKDKFGWHSKKIGIIK